MLERTLNYMILATSMLLSEVQRKDIHYVYAVQARLNINSVNLRLNGTRCRAMYHYGFRYQVTLGNLKSALGCGYSLDWSVGISRSKKRGEVGGKKIRHQMKNLLDTAAVVFTLICRGCIDWKVFISLASVHISAKSLIFLSSVCKDGPEVKTLPKTGEKTGKRARSSINLELPLLNQTNSTQDVKSFRYSG